MKTQLSKPARSRARYTEEYKQEALELWRESGRGDLADCVAAADWIKLTGYVNPSKLVIMGASYGVVLVNCQLAVGHMKANRG
jgi:dipeptidyl aminopeptidase/acylaminoacyl peptidase